MVVPVPFMAPPVHVKAPPELSVTGPEPVRVPPLNSEDFVPDVSVRMSEPLTVRVIAVERTPATLMFCAPLIKGLFVPPVMHANWVVVGGPLGVQLPLAAQFEDTAPVHVLSQEAAASAWLTRRMRTAAVAIEKTDPRTSGRNPARRSARL